MAINESISSPNEIPRSDQSEEDIWNQSGFDRVPFSVYTSGDLYRRELDRLFYSEHWCYVGLEAEIPNVGDFKRTVVGERPVIMVRNEEGEVRVLENICAHRGVQFCRERHGSVSEFVCPYHQWTYDLNGTLRGVPYRRGIREDGVVKGGLPPEFRMEDHGLNILKVATRGGVVFASFDHNIEPFEEFLGEVLLGYFDRIFNGRKLRVLGYNRQRIPGNWKLMHENIKDPYHAGLLHTWFVTFGLWRADSRTWLQMDSHKRHAVMAGVRSAGKPKSEVVSGVGSYRDGMALHDTRQLDIVEESWWQGPTATMLTLFPSLIIQQQVNSLSMRHIRPRGTGVFDFEWTHFGFEDDTDEMTERRLVQANLFGPAGYVSADDGEVLELSQAGFSATRNGYCVLSMGGHDTEDATSIATETLIRGMYAYWRKVMGV